MDGEMKKASQVPLQSLGHGRTQMGQVGEGQDKDKSLESLLNSKQTSTAAPRTSLLVAGR